MVKISAALLGWSSAVISSENGCPSVIRHKAESQRAFGVQNDCESHVR